MYEPVERWYVRLIRYMVERSRRMAAIALVLIGLAAWGLTRVPTGFIPTEDQGYAMVTVQLPDGASLERTVVVLDELARICRENPAVDRTISIGGLSPLDNNASLSSAGIVYLMFKDWSQRGKGEDLKSIYTALSTRLSRYQDARTMVLVPPPDPGAGIVGRLPDAGRADRRQLRLRAAAEGRGRHRRPAPPIRPSGSP